MAAQGGTRDVGAEAAIIARRRQAALQATQEAIARAQAAQATSARLLAQGAAARDRVAKRPPVPLGEPPAS